MIHIYKLLHYIITLFEAVIWRIKRKVLFSKLGAYGQNVSIGRWTNIIPENLYIGDDVAIGNGAIIQSTNSKIVLGNHIMFGPDVSVHGGNHRTDILGRYMKSITLSEKRDGIDDADVIIEDDVWVGTKAIILKGVTIGRGSVIGAGAIVYKNVPPYSIVTGAKMEIRERFTKEQIAEHEALLCQRKNQ